MTTTQLSSDLRDFLELLRDSVTHDYESFVKRWTTVECFYELAVKAIYNRLALHGIYKDQDAVSNAKVRSAIDEIAEHSPLGQLIKFDKATGMMPFNSSVTEDMKVEISNLLLDGTTVLPTPMQKGVAKNGN